MSKVSDEKKDPRKRTIEPKQPFQEQPFQQKQPFQRFQEQPFSRTILSRTTILNIDQSLTWRQSHWGRRPSPALVFFFSAVLAVLAG